MSAWLITGGAGFIGSNFVTLAAPQTSDKLIILDALTYAGDLTRLQTLLKNPQVEFIHGDITNSELVQTIFQKNSITHVVHFAAESHVDRSITGSQPFIKTNIEGTYILLEAARKTWDKDFQQKLFLHISTDEVYGSLQLHEPAFTELSSYNPSSPYSASKAAADHLVHAWHKTYDLPMIISNCSNNYGPWQFPEKLIPLLILNALENKPLPIYGDGQQIRDWLHVNDHCEALLTIIKHGQIGSSYNVGGNNEKTNLMIANLICDIVDKKTNPTTSSKNLITHVTDRPGHDRRYAIDSNKLKRELNWQPRYHFIPALEELVEWYMQNKAWADSVRQRG